MMHQIAFTADITFPELQNTILISFLNFRQESDARIRNSDYKVCSIHGKNHRFPTYKYTTTVENCDQQSLKTEFGFVYSLISLKLQINIGNKLRLYEAYICRCDLKTKDALLRDESRKALVHEQEPDDYDVRESYSGKKTADSEGGNVNWITEEYGWDGWLRNQSIAALKLDHTERLILRIGGLPYCLSLRAKEVKQE